MGGHPGDGVAMQRTKRTVAVFLVLAGLVTPTSGCNGQCIGQFATLIIGLGAAVGGALLVKTLTD
jgi:hypothetical protein